MGKQNTNVKKPGKNDWFNVLTFEDDNKLPEIEIYDEIGYDCWGTEVTFKGFKDAADLLDDYKIRIDSPGGVVSTGLAIYDYNQQRVAEGSIIEIQIDGDCCSMASIVALSGSSLPKITENAGFMIHPVSGGSWGNIEDMEDSVVRMKRAQNRLKKIYIDKLDWTEEEVDKLLTRGNETWWYGIEALDAGICSHVLENPKNFTNLSSRYDINKMAAKYEYKKIKTTNKHKETSMANRTRRSVVNDVIDDDIDVSGLSVDELRAMVATTITTNKKISVLEANNLKLSEDNAIALKAIADAKITSDKLAADLVATEIKNKETALALRKEALLALSKTEYSKLGKEEDTVDILMDVETNCTPETFTALSNIFAKANNIILTMKLEDEHGTNFSNDLTGDAWIAKKVADLVKSGMSTYDANKTASREYIKYTKKGE